MTKTTPHFQVFSGVKLTDTFDMYPVIEDLISKSSELLHLPPATGARPLTKLDERAWVEFYFNDLFYRLTNRLRKLLSTAVDPSTASELDSIIDRHKINKPHLLIVHGTCCDLKRLLDRILNISGVKPDGSSID